VSHSFFLKLIPAAAQLATFFVCWTCTHLSRSRSNSSHTPKTHLSLTVMFSYYSFLPLPSFLSLYQYSLWFY
jgi:hypothetical protein